MFNIYSALKLYRRWCGLFVVVRIYYFLTLVFVTCNVNLSRKSFHQLVEVILLYIILYFSVNNWAPHPCRVSQITSSLFGNELEQEPSKKPISNLWKGILRKHEVYYSVNNIVSFPPSFYSMLMLKVMVMNLKHWKKKLQSWTKLLLRHFLYSSPHLNNFFQWNKSSNKQRCAIYHLFALFAFALGREGGGGIFQGFYRSYCLNGLNLRKVSTTFVQYYS